MLCRILILACVPLLLFAYKSGQGYGGMASYGVTLNNVHFTNLPGVPNCCPGFSYATGRSYNISLIGADDLLWGQIWEFSAGLTYSATGFVSYEPTFLNYRGNTVSGEFRHEMDIYLYNIPLVFSYKNNFILPKLFYSAGLELNMPFMNIYSQREMISSPEAGATFIDEAGNDTGKRMRNEFSGSLPQSYYSPWLGLNVRISYELPLNRSGSLFAAPLLQASVPFGNVSTGLDWSQWRAGAGIAIYFNPGDAADAHPEKLLPVPRMDSVVNIAALRRVYDFKREEREDTVNSLSKYIDKTLHRDTLVKGAVGIVFDTTVTIRTQKIVKTKIRRDTLFYYDTPELATRLDVVDAVSGKQVREVEIGALRVNDELPILPRIYFQKDSISMHNMEFDKKGRQYDIFDVRDAIGEKLKNSDSPILLKTRYRVDYFDSYETARGRIGSVMDFYSRNYGVDTSRFAYEVSEVSKEEIDEADDNEHKIDELRYVELVSNAFEGEGAKSEVSVYVWKPSDLKLKTSVRSTAGIRDWKLEIRSGGKPIRRFDGTGPIPSTITWDTEDELISNPVNGESVDFIVSLTDSVGNSISDTVHAALKKGADPKIRQIIRKRIAKFRKGTHELSAEQQRDIDKALTGIPEDRPIEIIGFADKMGTHEYNLDLANRRARSVAAYIGNRRRITKVRGTVSEIFDNSLPHGRVYSRSVGIRTSD